MDRGPAIPQVLKLDADGRGGHCALRPGLLLATPYKMVDVTNPDSEGACMSAFSACSRWKANLLIPRFDFDVRAGLREVLSRGET